ncbi:hypothetical protein E5676_scaffold257G00740 [Cucumis melo var. makuwa]|uniref:Transmembrane protein n=2 Tax=Cucumis melo TaxID=3656 RepID=A0A5D3D5E0_CUCMM|nr:hypothetical protein E6C27_scaffold280G00230 [Cucumis melo var. makuwa]TYK18767.1 hypothetical protein E5676_scaffold257G00740 [Cucumis melo var. makuwa]
MGLDDWELLDCHEDREEKSRHENEVISGQKLIADTKKELEIVAEFEVEEEEKENSRRGMDMATEKKKQRGRAVVCSFGIAVAATICSVLLGSHSHHHGGGAFVNKRHC